MFPVAVCLGCNPEIPTGEGGYCNAIGRHAFSTRVKFSCFEGGRVALTRRPFLPSAWAGRDVLHSRRGLRRGHPCRPVLRFLGVVGRGRTYFCLSCSLLTPVGVVR